MGEKRDWINEAKRNGISDYLYKTRVNRGWTPKEAATIKKGEKNPRTRPEKDIAIYYKDEFIMWGKIDEISEKLDVPVKKIKYWCTPTGRKRAEFTGYYGIYIEEEGD